MFCINQTSEKLLIIKEIRNEFILTFKRLFPNFIGNKNKSINEFLKSANSLLS